MRASDAGDCSFKIDFAVDINQFLVVPDPAPVDRLAAVGRDISARPSWSVFNVENLITSATYKPVWTLKVCSVRKSPPSISLDVIPHTYFSVCYLGPQ